MIRDSNGTRNTLFSEYQAIDLTLTIDERYPMTFPPHVPFVRRVWNWFEEDQHGPEITMSLCGPYFTELLMMDEHIGTHFDAAAHFIQKHAPGGPDPRCGDEVPIEDLCGNAVVIDVRHVVSLEPGVSAFIEPDLVIKAEKELGRSLASGDVVLFRTDWDALYYKAGLEGRAYTYKVVVTREAPGWPAPNVPCMQYLFDRGIKCVGIDAPSMGASHDGAPVHVYGLGAGMLFIESLGNLSQLPLDGAAFQFFPIKVARSSGGPGRAIAWVKR